MGFNKQLMILGVLGSVFVLAFLTLGISLALNYGNNFDDSKLNEFNIFNETKQLSIEYQTKLENGSINKQGSDEAVYSDSISSSKLLKGIGTTILKGFQAIPKILRIDPVVIGMIGILITLLATMAFIKVVTKQDP